MELADLGAIELSALFASGSLSPVDATRAALQRIEALDLILNAFRLVDAEAALDAARASEARWRRGASLGPLDGVPTSIKDLILTRGWPTLRGSRLTDPGQIWDVDAPGVARLREVGAVLLGKTNTAEFGWKGVTDSPLAGTTRNPWDPLLTPGGSSGGAAAALAAGMGALALCTDGGGSVRNPAGFTNLCGFKPTFGRVAAFPPNPIGSLANVCPMARRVMDLALMMDAIAKPDPRDWLCLPAVSTRWAEEALGGVRGLRIAASPTLGFAHIDTEVDAVLRGAMAVFADLGAIVEEIDPPIGDTTACFDAHWRVGVANALGGLPLHMRGLLDPGLDSFVDEGLAVPLRDYLQAQNDRVVAGQRMRDFHTRFDLLLTPTTAVAAFPADRRAPPGIGEDDFKAWTPFSYPFNLTMQPAISVPGGFTPDGRPVGIQIIGDLHDDVRVLRAALAFEAAVPLYTRRPELVHGLESRKQVVGSQPSGFLDT